MKKLLPFLLAAFIFTSCSTVHTDIQPTEKVVEVEGKSKNELYVQANQWMVDAFNNAKSVVQFSDKESGTITGKYLLATVTAANQYGPAQNAFATINIQVKDGRSKITVTPESFSYMKGNMYTLYSEEEAVEDINALIASFEESIKQDSNNDW